MFFKCFFICVNVKYDKLMYCNFYLQIKGKSFHISYFFYKSFGIKETFVLKKEKIPFIKRKSKFFFNNPQIRRV